MDLKGDVQRIHWTQDVVQGWADIMCYDPGRPSPAEFRSAPFSRAWDSYNLTWVVESYPPLEEVRLLYRKLMVRNASILKGSPTWNSNRKALYLLLSFLPYFFPIFFIFPMYEIMYISMSSDEQSNLADIESIYVSCECMTHKHSHSYTIVYYICKYVFIYKYTCAYISTCSIPI
jgi:hypothetical protein